jgi:exosortase A
VSSAVAAAPPASLARLLRPTLLALAIAVLAFAVLFHAEIQAAIAVWIASTAFGHCFLVLPIALFLAWERRDAFAAALQAGQPPHPALLPLLLILPLAAGWLIAELLGIMEGRQLMALAMLEVLAYALLGPALWRTMAVPLLYLFFLVPFGAFLTPALQSFTARFIDLGLTVLAIPHVVSNTVIEIPAGTFLVAEACAGLRFLIASIAFGVLYACTIYRSPARRIAFIAASIIIPIIANGLRALGIVVLGQVLGSAQAAAVDHIVYGWLFFTIVTVTLILAGLPFREDRLPPIAPRARPTSRLATSPAALVAIAGIILSAMPQAAAAWLGRGASRPGTAIPLDLAMPPGCTLSTATPAQQDVACAGTHLALRTLLFSPTSSPQLLIGAQHTLAGPGEIVASTSLRTAAGQVWRLTQTSDPERLYALGFWPTRDGASTGPIWRLHQALAGITGTRSAWRPLISVVAVTDAAPSPDSAAILSQFLTAQPDLTAAPERPRPRIEATLQPRQSTSRTREQSWPR